MCGVDHRLIKRPQPVVVCRRMSGPWPQAQLAWGSGLVGVAAAQVLGVKLGGPVAGRADLVGLDQISLDPLVLVAVRSEEHTSELQSLMLISYAVFCLKKKKIQK